MQIGNFLDDCQSQSATIAGLPGYGRNARKPVHFDLRYAGTVIFDAQARRGIRLDFNYNIAPAMAVTNGVVQQLPSNFTQQNVIAAYVQRLLQALKAKLHVPLQCFSTQSIQVSLASLHKSTGRNS